MYSLEFWGGPRDGDEIYQVVRPREFYWHPVEPPYSITETVNTPVVESKLNPVESHSYVLYWKTETIGVYVYKGIVNLGLE